MEENTIEQSIDQILANYNVEVALEEDATRQKQALVAQLEETQEWQFLKLQQESAKTRKEELRKMIEQLAVDHFKQTGDKEFHEMVSVVENKKVKYSEKDALAFCIEKSLTMLLNLNKTMFEKHVKAVADTAPVPVAEIVVEPAIRISGKLNEYLAEHYSEVDDDLPF